MREREVKDRYSRGEDGAERVTCTRSGPVLNVYLILSFWEATQRRPFIYFRRRRNCLLPRGCARASARLYRARASVCAHRNVKYLPFSSLCAHWALSVEAPRRISSAILQPCKSRGGFLNTSMPSSKRKTGRRVHRSWSITRAAAVVRFSCTRYPLDIEWYRRGYRRSSAECRSPPTSSSDWTLLYWT